jgi:hypothetical protein
MNQRGASSGWPSDPFDDSSTGGIAMKLVILDRDGTINADSDEFVKSRTSSGCRCPARSKPSRGSTMRAGTW